MRTLGVEHTAVVHGDARCYNIACASIVAKVTRDRLMSLLALRYPGYNWAHNVGYSTPDHLAGLNEHGATPHHRYTFCRVSQLELLLPSSADDDDVFVPPLDSLDEIAPTVDLQ